MRLIFFNSYILPILDYCCTVWGECNSQCVERLNKMLKRSAREILDADFMTPSNFMFRNLKWLNIQQRFKYQKAILVFKSLNNLLPSYIQENITLVENSNYYLRSSEKSELQFPRPKTNFMKQTFHYSGAQIWNNLPNEIKTSKSLSLFKERCFEYIFNCMDM